MQILRLVKSSQSADICFVKQINIKSKFLFNVRIKGDLKYFLISKELLTINKNILQMTVNYFTPKN